MGVKYNQIIQKPKFSIIIPTRNRKEMLKLCIKSVLNQSYDNFEIIIHDNNSNDGTEKMITEFKNNKLRYFKSKKDLTMHENWNRAFKYVTGDYFIRLDDDNLFCFDLLEKYSQEIIKHGLNIMIGYPITLIDKESFKLYFNLGTTCRINIFQWLMLDLKMLTDSNYIAYNVKLVKKVFINNIIYETSVPDRYMNLKIMSRLEDAEIKIGLITDIVGVTRYDYERQSIDNNKLENLDIRSIFKKENIENIVKNKDCRGLNFTTHLLLNIIYFNNNNTNIKIIDFIERKLYSKHHYKTVIKINNLNSQKYLKLNENYKTITSILFALFIHPKSYLYGQPAYKFFFNVITSGIAKLLNINVTFQQINQASSEVIINSIIHKEPLHFNTIIFSENGDINNILFPFSTS